MDTAARILDASFNRAREALRTMEDAARFGLDHADLAGQLKALRHELRVLVERLPLDRGRLVAGRDVEGDVGTGIATLTEQSRAGIREVALAAAARLGESLRSMEEVSKTLVLGAAGSNLPAALEKLRYRAYLAEQQLTLAFGTARTKQWKLCVLLSESACVHSPWEVVVKLAIDGGADCFQLREKSLPDRALLDRARKLVELCRPRHVAVIVNDRPDIALLAGADGVHLGQTDLEVADVRRIVGFELFIGVSASNTGEARRAALEGADYCGVGPMFASETKPKSPISGPEFLQRYLADPACSRLPHMAISGITPANVARLAAVGCKGIAVSSAVCKAEDPTAAARELIDALGYERP